jgi:hypothetical protein
MRCLAIEESRSASAAKRLVPQRDRRRRDTPDWILMAASVYHRGKGDSLECPS